MAMHSPVTDKLDTFFGVYPEVAYAEGDIILFANDDHTHVIRLTDGIVGQYDIGPSGNKTYVNIYKPPAFFPMSWAINRRPNEYFFEAVSDVRARVAPPDAVVDFIKANPDVLFDLLRRVYIGTDSLLRKLAVTGGGSAADRLALELVITGYRFGKPGDGGIRITMSHAELATHAGLTRETVTRALQVLREAGLVSTAKGSVLLKDVPGLEAWYMNRT